MNDELEHPSSVLNLENLRRNISLSTMFPASRIENVFASVGPLALSRRNLLQIAAAGAATAIADLMPCSHRVELYRHAGCLLFFIDGQERWRIDPSRFSGVPVLETSLHADGATFALRDAYYPGTELPAGISGSVYRRYGVWILDLSLELGGFKARLSLTDWLLRNVPAASFIRLSEVAKSFGAREQVLLRGSSIALFQPSWNLRLDGDSIASWGGPREVLVADSFQVSIPAVNAPSLLREAGAKRSLLALAGKGKDWSVQPEMPSDARWKLIAPPGLFDLLQIEIAETPECEKSALVLHATDDNARAKFYLGSVLQTIQGTTHEIGLEKPRYAVTLTGDQRQTVFMADFNREPVWVQAAGIALQLGRTENSRPFEVAMNNGVLSQLHVTPALLNISAPLDDDSVAAGPVAICDEPTLSFRFDGQPGWGHRLKCWLGLCDDAELCIPMHGSRLPVLRHADMLRLDFEFVNLVLHSRGGKPKLVRITEEGKPAKEDADPKALPESLIIVHFPPQNIYEQAFFEGKICAPCDPDHSGTEEKPKAPVQARLSGPSRIALRVNPISLPYTLESLLSFSEFEMKVVDTAAAPGSRPEKNSNSKPVPPGATDTALELPYRLYLSPNRFAGWANRRALPENKKGSWIELWHTRLGVRNNGAIDERETARRTLRAIWSPDYSDNPCLPENVASGPPFRGSLSVRDRIELVELSSNFSLKDRNFSTPYQPNPVAAELLMLSSLGAWLKSTGTWDPPANAKGQALTVELWKHVATLGRDHYVRVEYKGYLMPFGYPCTLVKVTERKFEPTADGQMAPLRQRLFIVIKKEEKTYAATGQQHGGRGWPFVRVMFEKNYTTPPLDEPCKASAFFPQVNNIDHVFRYKLQDRDGTIFDCCSPLKFVDATVAYSGCQLPKVIDAPCEPSGPAPPQHCGVVTPQPGDKLTGEIEEYNKNTAQSKRRLVSFYGRKLAYAESSKVGDTQFSTDVLHLWTEPRDKAVDCAKLFTIDQAPFYPAIEKAEVHVDSISDLTRDPSAIFMAYHQAYLDSGFSSADNRGEIFARFLNGAVQVSFSGKGANADKSGGVVTPNAGIVGLSRKLGPVGGRTETSLSVTARGGFDPAEFFGGALAEARILGGIKLFDIIQTVAGDVVDALEQVPRLLRRAAHAAGAVIKDESRIFHSALEKPVSQLRAFLNPPAFAPVKPRLDPPLQRSEANLKLIDDELKKNDPDDLFGEYQRDETLINLQGQIIRDIRDFLSQLEDVVRNPQVLLTTELTQWVGQVTGLDALLAPPIQALKAIIDDAQQGIDHLAQAAVDKLFAALDQAGNQLVHSRQFRDAVASAKAKLFTAISNITIAELQNAATTIGEVLKRAEQFRQQVRAITDLAHLAVTNAQQTATQITSQIRTLAQVPGAVTEQARQDLIQSLQAIETGNPNNVGLRRTKLELLKAHEQLQNLFGTAVTDAEQAVAAQLDLLRAIQALLGNLPDQPAVPVQTVRDKLRTWARDLTCQANAKAEKLQPIVDMLSLGASSAEQLVRLGKTAAAAVGDVRAAQQALSGGVTVENIGDVVTLLERFRTAAGYLEKSADVLHLPDQVKATLKEAGGNLDTLITTIRTYQAKLEQARAQLMALAQNAPVLLRTAIEQQVTQMTAPLAQVATAVEQDALNILADFLTTAAHFSLDLLNQLQAPAEIVRQLLDLKKQIEQQIANLLAPKFVELSYTWKPNLKTSDSGIFELIDGNGKNLLLTARIRSKISPTEISASISDYSITGRLERFRINLLSKDDYFVRIEFKHIQFTSQNGSSPHCDVSIDKVKFGAALKFVSELAKKLNPKEGPFLEITPAQIAAGFRFTIPAVRSGGFSMKNLRVDAAIVLPFNGDPARFRFRLAERDNPFTLSVGIFGGAGWFAMAVGLDGVDEIDLGLEFGLAGDISIGVATGYGRVMGGIYIQFHRGQGTTLTGFIDMAGHVDVLGLISLSLSVYYGIRYLPSGDCFGEATIVVKIEMFFFDLEVRLHTEKQFTGDKGAGQEGRRRIPRPMFQTVALTSGGASEQGAGTSQDQAPPLMAEEEYVLDWNQYRDAFAAI